MNKKTKLIFITTLLIGLISLVLAFWAAGVFVDSDEDSMLIHVGQANEVFTTITINGDDASNLVPIGTLGNSPNGSVEYVIIPLDILWSENGTDWAEGLEGNFVITPTVALQHNVSLVNEPILEKATSLINVCFITGITATSATIANALDAVDVKGTNAQKFITELTPFGLAVERFDTTLTIDIPRTIYLVVFIDRPDIDTFEYIYESIIVVNAAITVAKEQNAPVPIKEVIGFKMTASGTYHTIALDDFGRLWGWGNNGNGQVGDGTQTNVMVPKLLPTTLQMQNVRFVHITAGSGFSVAIDSDGRLWSWGSNYYGEIGNGVGQPGERVLVPTLISHPNFDENVKFIYASSGENHTIAIDSNYKLWSWGGANSSGELGNPLAQPINNPSSGIISNYVPTMIPMNAQMQGVNFKKVSARSYLSIALDEDGNLWSWGQDYGYGKTGHGTTYKDINEPTKIPPTSDMIGVKFIYISAGYNHVTVIDSNYQLWAWGWYLPCGNGSSSGGTSLYVPTRMTVTNAMQGIKFVQICSDDNHVLALDSLGRLWSWGGNDNGKTGLGTQTGYTYSPTLVESISTSIAGIRFKDITSYRHNVAIDLKGNLWTWGGDNNYNYGQLGNGLNVLRVLVPTMILDVSTIDWD